MRWILLYVALALLAVWLAFQTSPARAQGVDAPSCRVQFFDDGSCVQMPPPGTGLDANGRGWVHCPTVGPYMIHGGYILDPRPGGGWKQAPQVVICGRDPEAGRGLVQMIQQTSSRLEWTRPDGRREVIPRELLYPPF